MERLCKSDSTAAAQLKVKIKPAIYLLLSSGSGVTGYAGIIISAVFLSASLVVFAREHPFDPRSGIISARAHSLQQTLAPA
jgi:hypothetical protein